VTVVDSSAIVDFLVEGRAGAEVSELLAREDEAAAPDLLVFEVLAVLRRELFRGAIDEDRAAGAVEDLGSVGLTLIPAIGFRRRAWELRHNLTASDALFLAVAEDLNEPLATTDRRLAAAARRHTGVEVLVLGAAS